MRMQQGGKGASPWNGSGLLFKPHLKPTDTSRAYCHPGTLLVGLRRSFVSTAKKAQAVAWALEKFRPYY